MQAKHYEHSRFMQIKVYKIKKKLTIYSKLIINIHKIINMISKICTKSKKNLTE